MFCFLMFKALTSLYVLSSQSMIERGYLITVGSNGNRIEAWVVSSWPD